MDTKHFNTSMNNTQWREIAIKLKDAVLYGTIQEIVAILEQVKQNEKQENNQ